MHLLFSWKGDAMGKTKIGAIIALDGEKEYAQAVKNITAELKTLQSEGKLIKEQFSGQSNSLKALQEKYRNLQSTLDKQKQKQKAVDDGLKNATQSYEKQQKNVAQLAKQYESASGKLEKMKNSSGTTKKELEAQEKVVNELSDALKKGTDNQQLWANKVEAWQTKSNTTKTAIEKLNQEIQKNEGYMREARMATDKCATSIDGYGRKTKTAEKEAKKMNEAVDSLSSMLIAGGVQQSLEEVAGLLLDCAGAAGEFESSIAKLDTIADTTDISMSDLEGQIISLSGETGEAASNISDLAYDVISATGDTVNSVKLAENATKLATAGFTNSSSALSVLTTTINSYKMQASEATNISDSLIQTQNLGVLTIDKLSGSMGKAIATASAYNVDLYNVESGYVSLTKAGIGVDESTTYMAGMFSELGDAGSDVAQILKTETGQSFGQLMQSGYSVADVLDILYESVNQDSEALMNLWGSQEAGKASNAIINQGITQFNQNLDTLQNSLGTTEEAYKKIADTTDYAKEKFKNAANNLKITLGTDLNQSLAQVYKAGTKAFDWATEYLKKHPSLVAAINGLTTAISVLLAEFAAFAILPKITAMIKAFNIAMSANPAYLFGIAVASATVAIVSYRASIKDALDTTKEFREQLASQREEIEDSIKTHEEAASGTQAEWEANQLLVDKLYELNDVQDKTSGQKATMKGIVDQLKDAIPELADAFDEETSSINISKDAIDKLIEKQREYAMLDATSEAMKGFAEDAAKAKIAIRSIDDEMESLKASMDGFGYDYDTNSASGDYDLANEEQVRALARQVDALQEEKNAYQETYDTAMDKMDATSKVQDELSQSIEQTTGSVAELETAEASAVDATVSATSEMSEAMTKLRDSVAESIQSSVSMFEEFSGGTEISATEIIDNLNSQIDGISNWADNMEELAGAAGSGMTEEFYQYLAEMGPESANLVQELVNTLNGDSSKFTEICDSWTEAMNLDSMADSITTGFSDAQKATKEGQEQFEKDLINMNGKSYKAGMDAGFDSISEAAERNIGLAKTKGYAVIESHGTGMTDATPVVETAAQNMSDSVMEKWSQMPQQAYDNGVYVADGAAKGIYDGMPKVIKAAEDLAAAANNAFRLRAEIKSPSRVFARNGAYISEGVAKGITSAKAEAEDSVRKMCQSLIDAAQSELDIHSPSRKFKKNVGAQITKGIALGINEETQTAIMSMRSTADRLYNEALKTISKQAGKKKPDTYLLSVAQAQLTQADELQRAAAKLRKSALNDYSKSIYKTATAWFTEYQKTNKVTLEDQKYFWKRLKNSTVEGSKEYTKALSKVEGIEKYEKLVKTKLKNAFNVSEYTTGKNGEQQLKSAADYYSEIYSAANKYFNNYSVLHNVSLQKEEYYWQQVVKKMKKGTQGYVDAMKQLKSVQSEIKQEIAQTKENNKQYALSGGALETYKTYYQVSAKAEVQYWDIVRKKFKAGTQERIEADQKYYEAKENYNSKLEDLNQEYYENVKEVNEKLEDDIQSLTDTYNDAVKERKDAIYSSFGLFDEFESTSSSGQTLLYNLKTQVAGIADWEQQLSVLGKKGVLSDGLLKELQEMGPEASASIHALNQLSNKELEEYNNLWKQKNALAESQAVKENEALRKETKSQISELKQQAKEEIATYKKEYNAAVKELKKSIEAPLKNLAKQATKIGEDTAASLVASIKKSATKKSTTADLQTVNTKISKQLGKLPKAGKTIGTNTLQGILDGLKDEKKINSSAKSLVDALKKAIQKAADIHSPSKLFKKEIGVQLSAGVASGITEESKSVNAAGTAMIRDLLEKQKAELDKQQASLQSYAAEINNGAGLVELNNLIKVAPVQQVTATVDNTAMMGMFSEVLGMMREYMPQMANMQLVTDTGTLIGETSTGMSEAFAMAQRRRR